MASADFKLTKQNTEILKSFPDFAAGDTINVHIKIKEGNKERIQQFQGTVLQRKNPGTNGETFTLRKISDSIACLLYTSPSPRDLSTSRMPSSA